MTNLSKIRAPINATVALMVLLLGFATGCSSSTDDNKDKDKNNISSVCNKVKKSCSDSQALLETCNNDAALEEISQCKESFNGYFKCQVDGQCQEDCSQQKQAYQTCKEENRIGQPPPPEPENLAITYRKVPELDDSAALGLYLPTDGNGNGGDGSRPDNIEISGNGIDCSLGCWVSEDMSTAIFLERTGQSLFTVNKVPLNSSYQPSGQAEAVVSGVENLSVKPTHITYQKDQTAHYRVFGNLGTEKTIGTVMGGESGSIQGDWAVEPDTGRALVFQPDEVGQKVTVKYRSGESSSLEEVYVIDSSNYQSASGSFYGGSFATAFSPNNQHAALLTNAPNDYKSCDGDSDCSGPGRFCGNNNRCTAYEHAVRFFDLENMTNLGTDCGDAGQCGETHQCYTPTGDFTDGRCIPKRVAFGLGAPQMNICQETSRDSERPYTNARGPLSFDDRGHAFLVGGRDCASESNIQQTDILKFDIDEGEYEVVTGNSGEDFEASKCYDSEAEELVPGECTVYIEEAKISPNYDELIFTATSPEVQEARLAQDNIDIWRILRNGENKRWVGKSGEQSEAVQSFTVHALE
jgi:hypothetical protein